jgi:membrane-bound metal-dependent hydrolase YbcI (DUF457 family)
VLARAGFDRWSPGAVRTSVIAANLPDIDSIAGVFGTGAYLEYHRGITHSLIAIPVLSIAVAAALYKFTGNFLRTSVIACVALASHFILDYMNDYGVRPFLPFDGTTYYGDTLFIVDPVFDFILLGALIAGYFLPRRRQCAVCGLLLSTLYVGASMELRNLCRSYLPAVQHAAVSPRPLDPFRWSAFVDSPGDVTILSIDPFRGVIGKPLVLGKHPASEVTRRAAETPSAKALLEVARFPVMNYRYGDSQYRVTFFDARYYSRNAAPGAKVWLDSSLNVLAESLRLRQPLD